MADISKCIGVGCPFKKRCLRFTIKPNEFWQSFILTPYDAEKNKCDYFINTEQDEETQE